MPGDLRISTELKMWNAFVWSVLRFGSETEAETKMMIITAFESGAKGNCSKSLTLIMKAMKKLLNHCA